MDHLFEQLTNLIKAEIVVEECGIDVPENEEAHSTARFIFGALYGLAVQTMLGDKKNVSANLFDLATMPMGMK